MWIEVVLWVGKWDSQKSRRIFPIVFSTKRGFAPFDNFRLLLPFCLWMVLVVLHPKDFLVCHGCSFATIVLTTPKLLLLLLRIVDCPKEFENA